MSLFTVISRERSGGRVQNCILKKKTWGNLTGWACKVGTTVSKLKK